MGQVSSSMSERGTRASDQHALQSAAGERFAALGEGEDIRLKGAGIAGGALAADGRVVHLAGYAV